jgi:hypothetical protein
MGLRSLSVAGEPPPSHAETLLGANAPAVDYPDKIHEFIVRPGGRRVAPRVHRPDSVSTGGVVTVVNEA